MPNINISPSGVSKLLSNLKPDKAAGPDEIPARFLKYTAPYISTVLSHIFQQSIDTGEVPSDWRLANIAPIFKKGDRSKPSNYRPVSLTSIISKTLEHIVVSQVMNHLDKNSILTDAQHGFRSRRSCETQLLQTTDDILRNLNNKKQTDCAILDFSKAFDKVPHQRLRHKLQFYGIRNNTQQWIMSFLSNRKQRVVVDGAASSYCAVESGVPQGTVLGLLLFLLFINDINSNITSNIRLFADDCLVYRQINSARDQLLLQQDVNTLRQWADTWQMSFNVDKCHILQISLGRKRHFNYTMNNITLSIVSNHPYLGLEFDGKMSWNPHIEQITAKANRVLGFLRRNLKNCPQTVKALAYTSLVRPKLEYCASIWDPYHQSKINKIEHVQNQAARFTLNKPWRQSDREEQESVSSMVQSLGWETLEHRRRNARLTLMYKVYNNHVDVPHELPATTLIKKNARRTRP